MSHLSDLGPCFTLGLDAEGLLPCYVVVPSGPPAPSPVPTPPSPAPGPTPGPGVNPGFLFPLIPFRPPPVRPAIPSIPYTPPSIDPGPLSTPHGEPFSYEPPLFDSPPPPFEYTPDAVLSPGDVPFPLGTWLSGLLFGFSPSDTAGPLLDESQFNPPPIDRGLAATPLADLQLTPFGRQFPVLQQTIASNPSEPDTDPYAEPQPAISPSLLPVPNVLVPDLSPGAEPYAVPSIGDFPFPNPFGLPDVGDQPLTPDRAVPAELPIVTVVASPVGNPLALPFVNPLPNPDFYPSPFAPAVPVPFAPSDFAPAPPPKVRPVPAPPIVGPSLPNPFAPTLPRTNPKPSFPSVPGVGVRAPTAPKPPTPWADEPGKPQSDSDDPCAKGAKKKDDKKKRRKRDVCYKGTYYERANGLLKYRKEKIACR